MYTQRVCSDPAWGSPQLQKFSVVGAPRAKTLRWDGGAAVCSYFDDCEAANLRAIMEGMQKTALDSARLQQLRQEDKNSEGTDDPPPAKRQAKLRSTGCV